MLKYTIRFLLAQLTLQLGGTPGDHSAASQRDRPHMFSVV
jgi:hypothetical protein